MAIIQEKSVPQDSVCLKTSNSTNIKMERWNNKIAIVTGASSGIGKSIAEELCKNGVHVVGLARRKEKLIELSASIEKLAKGEFYPYEADITKEKDVEEAFVWTNKNVGPVSILVNNAGIGRNTTLVNGNTEDWKKVLDTNIFGLAVASKEAVKQMQHHKIDGHIVNINSVAGHYVPAVPLVNVYSASKFAVTSLTETLRRELLTLGSRIKVSSVSPGFTTTEILEAGGHLATEEVRNLVQKLPALHAVDVANCVLAVLGTPPHVHVTEMIVRPLGEMVD